MSSAVAGSIQEPLSTGWGSGRLSLCTLDHCTFCWCGGLSDRVKRRFDGTPQFSTSAAGLALQAQLGRSNPANPTDWSVWIEILGCFKNADGPMSNSVFADPLGLSKSARFTFRQIQQS